MDTELGKYFAALTGNASFRQMGQHSGINHSTIRRQLKGEGDATAALVAELTRSYGGNVLEAFVAAGFITKEEAGSPNLAEALRGASDMELAQEIVRRAASGVAGPELTEPIDLEHHDNVVVGGFGQTADSQEKKAAFDAKKIKRRTDDSEFFE